jgi:hypothetical protein
MVDLSGLTAWVSDVPATSVVASPARARDHDRVVRTALEQETPLPARFGQVVAGDAELVAALEERRAALEATLAKVDGAVEMTVRMLVPAVTDHVRRAEEPGAGGTASGRRYLERVAAVQREERNLRANAAIISERVTSAVGELVRAQSFARAGAGSSLVTLSHLVPRENVEAYRSALLRLRREDPALALMVSGPWAPYSFTEGVSA